MFGYVRYDMPNLYIKDLVLYQSLYCGLCKGIGKACGQAARLGLSYDVAFLSALLHNMTGTDVKIEKQNCFEHTVKKRPIAAVDPLTEELAALNTVLVYYKLTDDIKDGGRGSRRLWFQSGFRRARKKYPKLVALVENYMLEQERTERAKLASCDMAADPTANMMQALSDHFMGERATAYTRNLFYGLGKWVYLIDALDDYDKDLKKKQYNPFVLAYGAASREALMRENGEEVRFMFDTLFYSLRENLAEIKFSFNRDLTDNVILRGLPAETARVMRGERSQKFKLKL